MLKLVDADGIEGDTMETVPQLWWNASLAAGLPMAFSPEGGSDLPSMNWVTMSCCHCGNAACNPKTSKTGGNYTQAVDRYKWLEPRRVTSLRDRWGLDRTDTFHYVFFNGVGFEATENEWGSWWGLSPYNAEALKRIFTVQRFFSAAGTRHLVSPAWEPHVRNWA